MEYYKNPYICLKLKNNTMANYNVTVECTYTFDVEIMDVSSKAEAIRVATTEALEDMSIEDMKLIKARAKNVVKLENIDYETYEEYDNK